MLLFKTLLYEIYKASIYIDVNADPTDVIIAECLTYSLIQNETLSNPSVSTGNLAKKYFPGLYNSLLTAKNNLVSYSMMKKYIEDLKKPFLQYTESDIRKINEYYSQKNEAKQFSTLYFRPEMYSVTSLNAKDFEYLEKIHWAVMVPIANYYKMNHNIWPDAFKIVDAYGDSNIPGKQLKINVNGIASSVIYGDIVSNAIPSANKNIDNIEIVGNDIILTMK